MRDIEQNNSSNLGKPETVRQVDLCSASMPGSKEQMRDPQVFITAFNSLAGNFIENIKYHSRSAVLANTCDCDFYLNQDVRISLSGIRSDSGGAGIDPELLRQAVKVGLLLGNASYTGNDVLVSFISQKDLTQMTFKCESAAVIGE